MSKDGKWTYNNTEDGWWNHDTFDTKTEAIENGKIAAVEYDWSTLFVGQVSYVQLDTTFDADDVIYEKATWLDENYGGDYDHGEKWQESISQDDVYLLAEMLEEAFKNWLKKTNNYPSSFTIVNDEQIELPEEADHCE